MEYRNLGNSGLKVSIISYGDMLAAENEENQKKVTEVVQRCFDLGVNYFDSAELYGAGAHERLLGNALKAVGKSRDEYVVSTKIFHGDRVTFKKNLNGLSRKHLIEGVEASLKRLQLDYVDILFCHKPDSDTPLEETVLAFKDILSKNLCLYWSTSLWEPDKIMEAYWLCEKYGVPKPIAEQAQYNMVCREKFEVDFAYLFDKYRMGSTIWGALSGGLLTGKLVDENIDTKGTRYELQNLNKAYQIDKYTAKENIESTKKMFAGLGEIAKEFDCTIAELAVAWVLKNKDTTTVILGLTKAHYVDSALKSVEIYKKITKEHEEKIDKILGTLPDFGLNYKNFTPNEPRRYNQY